MHPLHLSFLLPVFVSTLRQNCHVCKNIAEKAAEEKAVFEAAASTELMTATDASAAKEADEKDESSSARNDTTIKYHSPWIQKSTAGNNTIIKCRRPWIHRSTACNNTTIKYHRPWIHWSINVPPVVGPSQYRRQQHNNQIPLAGNPLKYQSFNGRGPTTVPSATTKQSNNASYGSIEVPPATTQQTDTAGS